MEQHDEKLFAIGELARKAGVTVRTLQYYDKCGLLFPHYSEGGRRLYNRDDVIRLQQILFFKSFGFSLDEIRDRLLPAKSADELERILNKQHELLTAQISQIQKVADMMKKAIVEIKADEEIEVDKLITIMEVMQQGNPYAFILRYFRNDQFKYLQDRFTSAEEAADFTHQMEKLFADMMALYKKGADPVGPDGQNLAARWWKMVVAFTGGDTTLLNTLISAGTDVDNWPGEAGELKQATKIFLERALSEYFQKNDIQLFEKEMAKNG
ncbi:MAG TPA: MerR family transcriptional regulator [Syntrophomonadaceae bacterium]|nr:MerR family transcriptional regulator [Syntrophomonadaceae bacterium]